MFHMCGNPGWKSNFILLCSLSVLLRLKPCNAKLPLRAGLIRCRCTNNKYHIAGNFVRQRFLQSNTSSRKFVPAKVFFHFCDLRSRPVVTATANKSSESAHSLWHGSSLPTATQRFDERGYLLLSF